MAGQTFRYSAEGPVGLAGGKTVIIASARGGLYAPGTPQAQSDFHEPYLRTLFRFIGIDEVTIVRAEGMAISSELRETALAAAFAETARLSAQAGALAA